MLHSAIRHGMRESKKLHRGHCSKREEEEVGVRKEMGGTKRKEVGRGSFAVCGLVLLDDRWIR